MSELNFVRENILEILSFRLPSLEASMQQSKLSPFERRKLSPSLLSVSAIVSYSARNFASPQNSFFLPQKLQLAISHSNPFSSPFACHFQSIERKTLLLSSAIRIAFSNEKFSFCAIPIIRKVIDAQQAFARLATAIYSCWVKRTCGTCWKSIRRHGWDLKRLRLSGWRNTKRRRSRKVDGKFLNDSLSVARNVLFFL